MKKHALVLSLLLLLTLMSWSLVGAADSGTEKNPLKTKGPMGKWVANKLWMMRATRLQYVESMGQLEKLPWTKRLTPKTKESLFRFMKGQFESQEAKLVLVTVEIKNTGAAKREVGCDRPDWVIRTDDGQQAVYGGYLWNKKVLGPTANSNEAMRAISFCIQGGMPQLGKVNPGGKTGGIMAFLIPSYADASLLFFNMPSHNGGEWVANESLVLKLKK